MSKASLHVLACLCWYPTVVALNAAALLESLGSSFLPQKRIVNGDRVVQGNYPYLALSVGTTTCFNNVNKF